MKPPRRQIVEAPNRIRRAGCFITGTDTGVGKTLVTAALAVRFKLRGQAVGVMKPVETGYEIEGAAESDAVRLRAAAGMAAAVEAISPYRFPDPLAPLDAARRAGTVIHLSKIVASFHALAAQHALMLIEGAGGVRVPISEKADMLDLIEQLGLPAIVVGCTAIGSVNHVLLTIEALARRRISIAAIVLNQTKSGLPTGVDEMQQASTLALLRERSHVPVVGPLPYEPRLQQSWAQGCAAIAESAAINELADYVMGTAKQNCESPSSHRPRARLRK
jgi:dethiobiotin synthetase